MIKHSRLEGLIAAPFTPFQTSGDLNLAMIERQAEALVRNGVRGAFVCGTTGEGSSLTLDERMQIAKRWRAVAGPNLRLIVHVGDPCLENCQTLARHAQKIGADAFSCLAPYFFKPGSPADLAAFVEPVAASAPELPFYFYHIPSMTGVTFEMATFLAAASKIPNLAGVKFTHENLMDFLACLRLDECRYDMVYGRDEALLAGLATGARAAIGSTYNFAAPIYNRLIAAFERGDMEAARSEQSRSVELIRLLGSYGFMSAAKATMSLLELDLGPNRSPIRSLSLEEKKRLAHDLERLGFFDWLK